MENTSNSDDVDIPIIEDGESSCLICDARLSVTGSFNIFYTSLSRNGELLANFVQKILRLTMTNLSSSYVCLRCYDLLKILEQAERTVINVKREILRVYRKKSNRENDKILGGKKFLEKSSCSSEKIFNDAYGVNEDPKFTKDDYRNRIDSSSVVSTDDRCFAFPDSEITNSMINDSNNLHTVNFDNDYRSERIVEISSIVEKFNDENNETSAIENIEISDKYAKNVDTIVIDTNYEDRLSVSNSIDNEDMKNDNLTEICSWTSGRISKYSQKPLKYSCTTCDKKWRTSAELKTHVKSHSSLRPYMCEKCGQSYKHKYALEIHVGMHNGVSPFKCNVCDKYFTQKGALMRHLPMHTGEKPYQCELCGKRFVHHTSYNIHALTHTGKKPYRCHVCDLSLLSTSHLKRHMRVHTGEKPYRCSLCGKSFAERYNLLTHQKIHDPAEIMAKAEKKMLFKCERCDKHFDKKQKLNEHAMEHEINEMAGQSKLLGHTIEVNTSKNVESSRTRVDNNFEESWREIDHPKFTNSPIGLKLEQSTNQISQESINILISPVDYNRIIMQSSNSENITEIDKTQT